MLVALSLLEYQAMSYKGTEYFSEQVYQQSGAWFAIMTSILFDANKVRNWKPHQVEYSKCSCSALCVNSLLAGNKVAVKNTLMASSCNVSLEGACQHLGTGATP